jgi:hypothetical protein
MKMKSETRSPKAEGNPKAEIRGRADRPGFLEVGCKDFSPGQPHVLAPFGFRASFGFRPSGFGFYIGTLTPA